VTQDPFAEWSRYHLAERALPDGRYAVAYPITFGRARVAVMAKRGDWVFQDEW